MYKIITDSCCDLPYEIMKREMIDFISIHTGLGCVVAFVKKH